MYRKNEKWLISKFLKEFSHLDWYIPLKFLANSTPEDDVAWTEVPDSFPDEGFLELSNEKIVQPTDVDLFLRQPYNSSGVWVENSSFASINAVLYPSPESSLLEAIDVGFRGLSGAIALRRETPQLAGMFVVRGAALGLKENAKLPDFIKTSDLAKDAFKDALSKATTLTTEPVVMPSMSPELRTVCEYLEARLDNRIGMLENKLENGIRKLEDKVDYLVNNTLMRSDLQNLLSVAALKRGLIVSSQAIHDHIKTGQSVEVKAFAELQVDE